MTSNAGTSLKASSIGFANDNYIALENKVKEVLKETFRPEFLNRVDEIIVFNHLTKDELKQIVDLMFKDVVEEVENKKMTVKFQDGVREFILEKGYDPSTVQGLLEGQYRGILKTSLQICILKVCLLKAAALWLVSGTGTLCLMWKNRRKTR